MRITTPEMFIVIDKSYRKFFKEEQIKENNQYAHLISKFQSLRTKVQIIDKKLLLGEIETLYYCLYKFCYKYDVG